MPPATKPPLPYRLSDEPCEDPLTFASIVAMTFILSFSVLVIIAGLWQLGVWLLGLAR